MFVVRAIIFFVVFGISVALIGIFSWYTQTDWSNFNKFDRRDCEIYGMEWIKDKTSNLTILSLNVAMCDNSEGATCGNRCFGKATDIGDGYSQSLTTGFVNSHYQYYCNEYVGLNDPVNYNCTGVNPTSANYTYICYVQEQNLNPSASCPTGVGNATEPCCGLYPGTYIALRRHINGTFMIIPFAIVFALVSFFGMCMSCFMKEEKTINVYKIAGKTL